MMVSNWYSRVQRAIPLEVKEALDQAQLVVLRQIVRFNQATAKACRWARPMAAYWWMPVAGLAVGVVAGVASRLAS